MLVLALGAISIGCGGGSGKSSSSRHFHASFGCSGGQQRQQLQHYGERSGGRNPALRFLDRDRELTTRPVFRGQPAAETQL